MLAAFTNDTSGYCESSVQVGSEGQRKLPTGERTGNKVNDSAQNPPPTPPNPASPLENIPHRKGEQGGALARAGTKPGRGKRLKAASLEGQGGLGCRAAGSGEPRTLKRSTGLK